MIFQLLEYEAPVKKVESEKDVVRVVEDLESSLTGLIGIGFNPKDVLGFIRNGKYEYDLSDENEPHLRVDLSHIKKMFESYDSVAKEKGCRNCFNLGIFMSFPGERSFYCGLAEIPSDTELDKNSRLYEKYCVNGCDKRSPIYGRTIEEIAETLK